MNEACDAGDVATLQALCECGDAVRVRLASCKILSRVCFTGGHVHVAQWVVRRFGPLPRNPWGYLFGFVMKSGHLALAQWFVRVDHSLEDNVEKHLPDVCGAGQLEVAQWLRETGHDATFDAYADHAFVQACEKGHLHVARWLLSLGAVDDVEACIQDAFRTVVRNGHLAVAKWLVSLGTLHIRVMADDVASWCGQDGDWAPFGSTNWHMCRWLFSLDPREAAWPTAMVRVMATWSPTRDAWMRGCVGTRA